LLPNPALKPAYDKAVWLYVYRDFSSSADDSAAERICLRLGMTSYPQTLLIDPSTLARLGDTGRTVETFLPAVNAVHVKKSASLECVKAVAAADERAKALQSAPSPAAALKALDDADIVVRYIALGILAEKDPGKLVARAGELLAVPHDPFRYEVCRVLAKAGDVKAAPALESLLRDAPDSLNPNVVRIEAARALAGAGSADSIQALRPFAASGDYRNGLTLASIDAISAIAARDKLAKPRAREALLEAYPEPAQEESERTMCVALAKQVHAALGDLTGKKVKFPERYDEAARAKLIEQW